MYNKNARPSITDNRAQLRFSKRKDMDKKAEYMNFPVTILQGAFKDVREAVDNIMDYAPINIR